MQVDIIPIPNTFELLTYSKAKKERVMQNLFLKYVEKIDELYLYASNEEMITANNNVKIISDEIEKQEYLSLNAWELYRYYSEIRNYYDDLVVLVNNYRKREEAQKKYREGIAEKINTIEKVEAYMNGKKDECVLYAAIPKSEVSLRKDELLSKNYTAEEYERFISECDRLIMYYFEIINEEQSEQLTGIDSVINQAMEQGKHEQDEATGKVAEGFDMFRQLQQVRKKANQ